MRQGGKELYHTPGSKGGRACGAIFSFTSWGVVLLRSYHCGLPPGPCGLPPGPCGLPQGLIACCLEVRVGCLVVSSRVASRSVQLASRSDHGLPLGQIAGCLEVRLGFSSRSHRGLPQGLMCGSPQGPKEQTLRPKFSILGVFWPFCPKRALPHPISIQNMRFRR